MIGLFSYVKGVHHFLNLKILKLSFIKKPISYKNIFIYVNHVDN